MALPISDGTRAKIAAAWPQMLAGVARGDKIKDVVAAAGISHDMLRAYWSNVPGSRAEWDDARLESSYALEEKAQDIIETKGMDPADKRVQSDFYRWAAAKRNPRVYSDKVQHDVLIKQVDLTRIISEANARLAARVAPALANTRGEPDARAHAQPALPLLELDRPGALLAELL